jgi:hypothetical protein
MKSQKSKPCRHEHEYYAGLCFLQKGHKGKHCNEHNQTWRNQPRKIVDFPKVVVGVAKPFTDAPPMSEKGVHASDTTPSMTSGMKLTNPKDVLAGGKVPIGLCPSTLEIAASMAFLEGACKYGRANWRIAGVSAAVYYDALKRHLTAWWEGEDIDPKSGLPHTYKMAACIAILIDAKVVGKLIDDRPPSGPVSKMMDDLEPHVARLKEEHKDKHPRHYSIADTQKKDG